MKNFIIDHDYVNNDWMSLINEVYREISGMTAAEIMTAFITKSRKILLSDKAFIAVVSGGKFYLEMHRGKLIWEFIFPEKKPAVSEFFHEITISWKEFVERVEITKEITIPYGDCGFNAFINIVRAEVPEELANSMAEDISHVVDKMPDDVSGANKRQTYDLIESGEFNKKFQGQMELLRFRNSVNKFEIARDVESALAHTLQQYDETTRKLLASGTFIYDMYEGEILFKVVGEEFKETDDDFRLKVIVREDDDRGLPYASYEVQSTFNM